MSDDQTTDRCSSPSIEELLAENKMKDLALSKATNLIELLSIELEVQKNSHEENMQELRQNYQKQLRDLQEQIELLQREVKKKAYLAIHEKPTANPVPRPSGLLRANSTKSLENRKRSINKKYTQTLPEQPAKHTQISHQLYRQHLVELQHWKFATIEQLDELVRSEYNSLQGLIGCIESCSEEYDCLARLKSISRTSEAQLWQIIRGQNTVINSMKAYCQQLQDQIKSVVFRLNSMLTKNEEQKGSVEVDGVFEEVMRKVQGKREKWRECYSALEDENGELKGILDNMIRLVREQKNIK